MCVVSVCCWFMLAIGFKLRTCRHRSLLWLYLSWHSLTSEGAQKGPGGKSKSPEKHSRQGDLNPRPTVYEAKACVELIRGAIPAGEFPLAESSDWLNPISQLMVCQAQARPHVDCHPNLGGIAMVTRAWSFSFRHPSQSIGQLLPHFLVCSLRPDRLTIPVLLFSCISTDVCSLV